MPVYLTARNPTDSVTHGLLPAAARLGLDVVLLTDRPDEHVGAAAAVVRGPVHDAAALATRVTDLAGRHGAPEALLSNSDHLQGPTALAAALLGLPAKPWRAALRTRNKRLTRQVLAAAGLDHVACAELAPGDAPDALDVPFPAVLKPREGVASEDVVLVEDRAALWAAAAAVRERRPGDALVLEEYLVGPLHTYETLGDTARRHHVGSWHTRVGPGFTETGLEWAPALPPTAVGHLEAQLDALGVGLGACHTEFVLQGDRARIVEVNYRLIGDVVDLVLAELLEVDLFGAVLAVHRGEPLPALPDPCSVPRHARVDYVLAERAGTLRSAPPDDVRTRGTCVVGHRRLRAPGTAAPWHGSNRDYLAAVHAIGPDAAAVDAAVAGFRAEHEWVVA